MADAVVRPVRVLTLSERVTVVKVEETLIIISAALLQRVLEREAVITNTVEGSEHVDTFPIFTNLNRAMQRHAPGMKYLLVSYWKYNLIFLLEILISNAASSEG